jgi:hypothetical protein
MPVCRFFAYKSAGAGERRICCETEGGTHRDWKRFEGEDRSVQLVKYMTAYCSDPDKCQECEMYKKLEAITPAVAEGAADICSTEVQPDEPTALEAAIPQEVQPFDYSTVDNDTAAFLQEKAARITEIRIKSVVAMGKELKEAQEKLSNHKTGTFGLWSQSVGFSRQTVQNYIQGYDYIVKNFDNIIDAEKIQPSLLFAASKPSAPAELQQGVMSGDITTHKQYKDLERKLKEAEERAERAVKSKYDSDGKAIKAEQDRKKLEDESKKSINAQNATIHSLQQQLDQAKRNGDPAKVQELGKIIEKKQQKITDDQAEIERLRIYIAEKSNETAKEINNLKEQLNEKDRQLHDKPIEVPATVEKEVIPEEVALAIYGKIAGLYEGLERLTTKEVEVFAEQVDPDYLDDIVNSMEAAREILDAIEAAAREKANEPVHRTKNPGRFCGGCRHSDPNTDDDKMMNEDLTYCTIHKQYVGLINVTCDRFEV